MVPFAPNLLLLAGATPNCTSTPALPASLHINPQTCVISGTPRLGTAPVTYTIRLLAATESSPEVDLIIEIREKHFDDRPEDMIGGLVGLAVPATGGILTFGLDTDCDGNMNEMESQPSNCTVPDSGWTPRWSSIKAYFSMDDATSSVNGVELTAVSTGTTQITPGKVGANARSVTTSGAIFAIPTTNSAFNIGTGDFTVSFWHKPLGTSNSDVFFWRFDDQNLMTILYQSADNLYRLSHKVSGAVANSTTVRISKPNMWHHLVLTRRSGAVTLTINSRLAGELTDNRNIQSSEALILGRFANPSNNSWAAAPSADSQSHFDEFLFWSEALDIEEINHLYLRGLPTHAGHYSSRVIPTSLMALDAGGLSWRTDLPYSKQLLVGPEVGYSGSGATRFDQGLLAYWPVTNATGNLSTPPTSGVVPASAIIEDLKNDRDLYRAGLSNSLAAVRPGIVGQAVESLNEKFVYGPGPTEQSSLYAMFGQPQVFTIAAWLSASSYRTGNREQYLLTLGDHASLRYRFAGAQIHGLFDEWRTFDRPAEGVLGGHWNHLALVFDLGTGSSSTARLYLNGVLDTTIEQLNPIDHQPQVNFRVLQSGPHDVAVIDEMAVWGRALSATEIEHLYRRGAHRVWLQVRGCQQHDCSDNPTWSGPNGVATSTSPVPVSIFSENLDGQNAFTSINFSPLLASSHLNYDFFQYRVFIESDSPIVAASPRYPVVEQVSFVVANNPGGIP